MIPEAFVTVDGGYMVYVECIEGIYKSLGDLGKSEIRMKVWK